MTTTKTPIAKKKAPSTKQKQSISVRAKRVQAALRVYARNFLARRPHRSFKQTRRRDYVRQLTLPGYWSFTNYVRKTLVKDKRTFILMALFYAVLSGILVGLASQDNYTGLTDTLRTTSGQVLSGNWGEIGKAGLLVLAGATGDFNGQLSESQQIYAVIISLFVWLTTVWLLRAQLAGGKPKLREGLYGAGTPVLSTFLVTLVMLIQLLPVAIAAAAFGALASTGAFDGGVEAMVLWTVIALLAVLSLYWMTSTLIALVVVTLPGMYPMKAIRIAGDLVVGRRLRIMLRLIWMIGTVVVAWAIIMIPVILFDTWLKGLLPGVSAVPIIPIILLILTSYTLVWVAGYVYLLYRKVVDDDAAPA